MKASVIIRVGDLCISHHVARYIGIALDTVVLRPGARDRLTPAACDIFWSDSMRAEEGLFNCDVLKNYRIVR
jgi:hypothetical protein